MKSKIIGLIIGVIVLGGLIINSLLNVQTPQENISIQVVATSTVATSSSNILVNTPVVKPVTNTPKPQPTPAPTSTPPAITGYTSVQVSAHADRASCWSIVNNNVYDLTNWINKHPGGQSEITAMCGKDATNAFDNQHGGDAKPERILASFLIGAFIK
jgi:cytochrome b involved in lipid metabolism